MRNYLKNLTLVWFSVLILCFAHTGLAAKTVNVAILQDGPTQGFQNVKTLFIQELEDLTQGEFDLQFKPEHQLEGHWSNEKIRSSLQSLQNNPDVDIILTLGFVSSVIAARSESFNKPTFAPLVIYASRLEIPRTGDSSGVPNLNYITEEVRLTDDILAFRDIVKFGHLGLIVDKSIYDALPEVVSQGTVWVEELGLDLSYILNTELDENVVAKIPKEVDAVMVAAVPRLSEGSRQQLIDNLNRRKLPSYSLIGSSQVQRGMLAASSPDSDWQRLARKTALNVQSVLLGENAGDQPVLFRNKRELTINMKTAREIGVYPRFDVLSTATLLNRDEIPTSQRWTLSDVAEQALESNLDIQSSISGVKAITELENQARSVLRPQLSTSLGSTQLNSDSSSVASGFSAERLSTADLTLSQIIYSEPSLSDVEIQEFTTKASEAAHRTLELDIIQQSTNTFLNILKAQTLVDIRRRELTLSKTNYNLAKDRVELGSSSAADVYRWESEVATSRQNLLQARAELEIAMDSLNLLLHRPIDERFATVPASLNDKSLLVSRKDLIEIIDNERSFDRMGELMIVQAKENSPELIQIGYQIDSVERQLLSDQRSFWSPEVSISGKALYTIDEDPLLMNSNEDETDWQITLNLSLPLYQGGRRASRVSQSGYEIHQLELQQLLIEDIVESRVRQNLHAVRSSYPSIELTEIAATAARKNLDLVQDNYAKGNLSIIDFLDARDASLTADQNAANAVYDFLIDLMNLQRATAEFDFFLNEIEMQRSIDLIRHYISTPNN